MAALRNGGPEPPEGATKISIFSPLQQICIFPRNNVLIITTFYDNQKLVRFCYLVVFISTSFVENGHLFYVLFIDKNNAVQSCSNKVVHFNLSHSLN